MLIIYVWLAAVTALLVLLAYQQFIDHDSLESLFDITTTMRTRDDHHHDHLMKVESKIQDIDNEMHKRDHRIQVLEVKRIKKKKPKDSKNIQ